MKRRKNRRKKNGFRNRLLFGLTLLGLAAALLTQNEHKETQLTQSQQAETQQIQSLPEDSRLEVHYLDVDQGDATLILCDGHAMLIDAGNNNKGTQVQLYLKKQGVEKLDYVIGTHPDADHIGGLDVILYKFDCDTILMPEYGKDTKTYDDVIQTMKYKGYSSISPAAGDTYTLGSAAFTVVAPNGTYGENANDYSIGILLQHGENRFLFTGDAEADSEADMLENGIDLSADVYKAAHHGSSTANTEEFLEAVAPRYAVISCGTDNSYGHPHEEVLERFRKKGIQVFRTDEQGTILAVSNGKEITISGTN